MISAAIARGERGAAGWCDAPAMDTVGWQYARTVGIAAKVPSSLERQETTPTSVTYGTDVRHVSLFLGDFEYPHTEAGTTELGSCSTRIGGRPVTITVRKYAETKSAPFVYVATARWDASAGLPAVGAMIIANDPVTLDRMKVVFYTAEVGGAKAAIACVPEDPPPVADAVVDSAAIAMRVKEIPSGIPTGSTVLQLRFSRAGTLGSIGVLAGDLPAATERALALIVGTNVRDRANGDSGSVQLKVVSWHEGIGYEVLESSVCRR
jgi:hypothetical protein